MTTQTEAERLADALDRAANYDLNKYTRQAAAELRRLVSLNKQLMDEVATLKQAFADEHKNKQHTLGTGEMELSLRRNHKDEMFECRRLFSAQEITDGPDWLVEVNARILDARIDFAIRSRGNT